jgi:RNA polymerase sigma-70 factor (ECF subfamily)
MLNEEMIKKCVERDSAAWDLFVKKFRPVVAGSVRHKLRKMCPALPSDEYKDIVQEVFCHIWEKNCLSGVKDPERLKGWLIILSINRTSNYCMRRSVRSLGRNSSIDAAINGMETETRLGETLPDAGAEGFGVLREAELRSAFMSEVEKLGEKQRKAFKMSFMDAMKYKDIAEVMSIPVNTVITLVNRAKARVKENIADYLK